MSSSSSITSARGAIVAKPYDPSRRAQWDSFVAASKNGLFLYHRDYLEYHIDRYPDASVMFYAPNGTLVALLPATVQGPVLSSHAGLTFGGVVSDHRMKVPVMLDVFAALQEYAGRHGFEAITYKPVPHIYHRLPAEEDLYALHIANARTVRRDVSSTILLSERLAFAKGRRGAAQLAARHGVVVRRSTDFAAYFAIVRYVLATKYGYKPVHTAEEMALLAGRFPDNIKLFAAFQGDVMLAGVLIYESAYVAHAQYIAALDDGKRLGALDAVMSYLITDYYASKRYFDFGISTEREGRYLNLGMIDNKEGFGGRAIVHEMLEIRL